MAASRELSVYRTMDRPWLYREAAWGRDHHAEGLKTAGGAIVKANADGITQVIACVQLYRNSGCSRVSTPSLVTWRQDCHGAGRGEACQNALI